MILSILIPVYNEETYIKRVISEIRSVDLEKHGISEKEIILIDDGSTDNTVKNAIAAMPNIKIIHHVTNQGKGAAIASALPHVKGDIILIQDADLEYSPSFYPVLLKKIIEENADIVYGSRFITSSHPEKMMIPNFMANKIGTWLINRLYGIKLTDAMTCFKMFKKHTLTGIIFTSKNFDIDVELTAKTVKRGFKIIEVPISYSARTFKEGKKFHPLCSLKVLLAIIKFSFGK